ncbi:major facilitator superfamily transporter [Trichoderma arundinaceum]|uniref:Major facilitator superfamily transporter n=1 Tax=Trichoderma arundinaceum TaxID=490622 RepID=A0A395NGJ2_TRIAR|nr:major facilitator superfamily transporter [Trichoderma arundinaceum]
MEEPKQTPNTSSSQAEPIASEPKQAPNQDVEKAPHATPKPPVVEYPSGVSLLIVFVGLFLAALCVGLDRTIVATAIPKITSDFNSLGDVGWYGSAYLLTNCCFQLFFGKLYAEFHVKLVFLSALLIFEVGSIVCATAPNSVILIVGRAVAGIGGAGIVSGALIYTGAMGGSVGIAQITSPTLGGVFTDKATWRWCFWINLPLGAVTFFTVLFLVKIPSDPNRKTKGTLKGFLDRFDLVGTLVLIPWVICLLLALQWGGSEYAWNSWRIILLLVLFAVLFVLWLYIQYKEGNKATLPLRIIKQRSMAAGMMFMFFLFSAFFVINYYVPIWFQSVKGVSAYKSGIYFLTMSAGLSLAVIASGFLTTRIGYFVPNMIMSTMLSSVAAGLIYTFDIHTSARFWIPSLIIMGIGIGIGAQQPLMAAQTVFKGPDIALSTSALIFTQTLAGTIFLSVAENIFQNQLVHQLRKLVPEIDPRDIINIGASSLRQVIESRFPQHVFLLSVIFTCLNAIPDALMEWVSPVKRGKPAAKAAVTNERSTEKTKEIFAPTNIEANKSLA